jgi:hypothetical protein
MSAAKQLAQIKHHITELREAEFKSGMHRTQEKSDDAEQRAKALVDAIKAALSNRSQT